MDGEPNDDHLPDDRSSGPKQPSDPPPKGSEAVGSLSGDESPDELVERYRELEAERRRLDANQAEVLIALESREIPDKRYGQRTKAWVAVETGSPRRHAMAALRVASLLEVCPLFMAALREGRISVHHVEAIARSTNDRNRAIVIAMQKELLDLIPTYSRFEAWEAQVRDLLRLADEDGPHDPRPEDNRLTFNRDFDGTLVVKGTFVGPWALSVEEVLNKFANRELHRHRRDKEHTNGEIKIPRRSTLAALGFAEACRHLLSATTEQGRSTAADISLVIRDGDLSNVTTQNGLRVDESTIDMFLCDPLVHPVIVDSLGVPIDMGRTVRLATPAQRRALSIRDGGCVFPGCDAQHEWTDAHHVVYWERRGNTDLWNLASLCRHHHGVTHRTGWTMSANGDGRFTITTPWGLRLISQQHGRLWTPDDGPDDPTRAADGRYATPVGESA